MAASMPDRLQVALSAALRQRDAVAVSALRSALAAIGNAEALPAPEARRGGGAGGVPGGAGGVPGGAGGVPGGASSVRGGGAGDQYVAGSIAGLGTAEASRRALTEAAIAGIMSTEIAERRAAAVSYEQAGHADRGRRLRRQADVLAAVLSGAPSRESDG